MAAESGQVQDPLRLEERIWTADDEQLPTLEREAARRLQLDPYSAHNHFLLSHTYLRMFARDQQDSESLRTSSDLAAQAVELAPKEEFGYVAMVGILEALGQQEKAMAVIKEGLKNVPEGESKWRLVFCLARLMARETNASETMSALLAAMDFKGSIGRVIAPYVVIVEQSRVASSDEILQRIRKLAMKYPDSGFDESLASLLIEDGRYEQAHSVFTKLRKNPDVSAEVLFTDAVLS